MSYSMTLRQRGTVSAFNPELGCGSIDPAGGGDPVRVSIGAVERSGLFALLVGQEVEFTQAGGEFPRAVDIVIR